MRTAMNATVPRTVAGIKSTWLSSLRSLLQTKSVMFIVTEKNSSFRESTSSFVVFDTYRATLWRYMLVQHSSEQPRSHCLYRMCNSYRQTRICMIDHSKIPERSHEHTNKRWRTKPPTAHWGSIVCAAPTNSGITDIAQIRFDIPDKRIFRKNTSEASYVHWWRHISSTETFILPLKGQGS